MAGSGGTRASASEIRPTIAPTRLGHATARRVAWLPDTPRLPAETRALANAGLPDTNAGADGARPTGHPEADVGGGTSATPITAGLPCR